jgi:hypothetical protein
MTLNSSLFNEIKKLMSKYNKNTIFKNIVSTIWGVYRDKVNPYPMQDHDRL